MVLQNKIKLIQIIADSDLSGGPKHVLGLLKNIDKEKFDCHLICPKGNLSEEALKIPKVSVVNIPMRSKFDITAMLLIQQEIGRIRTSFDPFGPAIVHMHGTRAAFLTRALCHRGTKLVYTEHRYDADYHLRNPLNDFFQKSFLKCQNKKTDAIIAVSSSVRDFLISSHLAKKEKIVLIPNGIELVGSGELEVGRKIKENNKSPIIGNIGNLNIQKGQSYLIDAMPEILKSYPLATLEIIGEGEEKDNLKFKIKNLKLEHHISLLGRQRDVYKFMRHWDVFVLPSIAETFGIAILEAMNTSIPVIASRVGGIPDIISDKKNGILIPSREPARIAKAVIELLNHPVLAAKLKHAGKERVKEFDWKKIIKQIEEVYDSVVS